MTAADSICLALIASLLLLDSFVLWPAFLRRSQAAPGRARTWLWSRWILTLWALAAAIGALWLYEGRSWGVLRLVTPHGWRLWTSIGLALMLAITSARTAARIARSKRPRRIKMANPLVERLSPHERAELGWWVALAISAGFCEELVFRGYIISVFQPMFGLWGAAIFSVVVFGAAHAYQGAKGILATGVAGGVFTLVVLILGSLLPAMALHVLVDLGQGIVAWLAFRKVQGGEDDLVARNGTST
jgi:membrane protease YdiL (CAAX protease family)